MRFLGSVPHPDFAISIHFYNEKFIVKIESGPYEQHYKLTKEMAADEDAVKKLVTPAFLEQARAIFNGMHQNLKQSMGLTDA